MLPFGLSESKQSITLFILGGKEGFRALSATDFVASTSLAERQDGGHQPTTLIAGLHCIPWDGWMGVPIIGFHVCDGNTLIRPHAKDGVH